MIRIQESEYRLSSLAQDETIKERVVLSKSAGGFCTHREYAKRDFPEYLPANMVSGHYFPTLDLAMEDFNKRVNANWWMPPVNQPGGHVVER